MSRGEYSLFSVDEVQKNPEEYIIEDCLEACKILWDKGIDTVQCSNYEDKDRWIEIDIKTLSKENQEIFYDKLNNKVPGYKLTKDHYPMISFDGVGLKAAERLCSLANSFSLQDTNQYKTVEDYLHSYQCTDGEYQIVENGNVIQLPNPFYINATLEDALRAREEFHLYVPEEGRVYLNEYALKVHSNYLTQMSKKK